MTPFPGVISQLPGGKLITLHGFHYGRDNVLFLLELTFILDMGLPLLHAITSDKMKIHGFSECLITQHGIAHSIVCGQELIAQQKKCVNRSMLMKFTGLTMFPSIPRQLT